MVIKKTNYKHGHKLMGIPSPTYKSWCSMKTRCDNKKHDQYPNYGGRGITYQKEWSNFVNFLNDMGVRPDGMTLDRRDNELGYSKYNCKWSTHREQGANKRNSNSTVGVNWVARDRLWRAYAHIDGKQKSLGYSKTEEGAILIRTSWEDNYENS